MFDVINFDMINMITLGYEPACVKWVYAAGSSIMKLAVAEKDSPNITIYDSTNSNGAEPLAKVTAGHAKQASITAMAFSSRLGIALSADTQGDFYFFVLKSLNF